MDMRSFETADPRPLPGGDLDQTSPSFTFLSFTSPASSGDGRAEAGNLERRIVAVWFPELPTERLMRLKGNTASRETPLATVREDARGPRLAALNRAARAQGLAPGMTLSQARAMARTRAPGLKTVPHAPAQDRAHLERLALWAQRYTPWTAFGPLPGSAQNAPGIQEPGGAGADGPKTDGLETDGHVLWLDITGCGHLMGGDKVLLEDLSKRLRRTGHRVRAALAATPGAAWALARFGSGTNSPHPPLQTLAELKTALAPLPMAGLRLALPLVDTLARLGLRRIGDLYPLPRPALTVRFGSAVTDALDRALGARGESISPLTPAPALQVRLAFPEPIGTPEDLERALGRLLDALCRKLEDQGRGARRLTYRLFRSDGGVTQATVGTSEPVRDPAPLARLFREKLGNLEAGFGIDMALLMAERTDPLRPEQARLTPAHGATAAPPSQNPHLAPLLAPLLDRLGNRLGAGTLKRLAPHASHLPEAADRVLPWHRGGGDVVHADKLRPLHLLPVPEPLDILPPDVLEPSDTEPLPAAFRWRGTELRVRRWEGPERITPEWWQVHFGGAATGQETRDYFRFLGDGGHRFWVYGIAPKRPGGPPRWFLHGLFA